MDEGEENTNSNSSGVGGKEWEISMNCLKHQVHMEDQWKRKRQRYCAALERQGRERDFPVQEAREPWRFLRKSLTVSLIW